MDAPWYEVFLKRLRELREISPIETIKFLHKMIEIWRISPILFDLVLEILTGSRTETRSFSEKAADNHTSKQNEQQILQRDLEKLEMVFPELVSEVKKAIQR